MRVLLIDPFPLFQRVGVKLTYSHSSYFSSDDDESDVDDDDELVYIHTYNLPAQDQKKPPVR